MFVSINAVLHMKYAVQLLKCPSGFHIGWLSNADNCPCLGQEVVSDAGPALNGPMVSLEKLVCDLTSDISLCISPLLYVCQHSYGCNAWLDMRVSRTCSDPPECICVRFNIDIL